MRSGLFEHWQGEYAARGIVTFPVKRDKTPAVLGYLNAGRKASAQFALKFPDALGIGFACKRNRITVLDVDTNDERVLADGLARHGSTPIVVRTGSGNYQAWYRHNGEARKIRPDPGVPIDILGGGFVVAPPTQASTGEYRIIQGNLDDLDKLPKMKGVNSPPNKKQNTPLSSPSSFSDQPSKADVGWRNNELWRECMKMARGCRNIEELMMKAMDHNQHYYQPLPLDEVLKIVASAWGYEVAGKNWFGHGQRVVIGHAIVDELAAKDPRAYALLSLLQRHHWGRDFYLTKSYAAKLGWAEKTLRAARDALVERGLIECIHQGGRGAGDPPVYRFTKIEDRAA